MNKDLIKGKIELLGDKKIVVHAPQIIEMKQLLNQTRFSIKSEFNILGKNAMLYGTHTVKYPPFEDDPKEKPFE